MNAKELRQAAELATEWDGYIHHENKPAFSAWKLLANHILTTVREDDDEPIDSHWIGFGVPLQLFRQHIDHIKTRGDFRTLCRLLGVTLKEDV